MSKELYDAIIKIIICVLLAGIMLFGSISYNPNTEKSESEKQQKQKVQEQIIDEHYKVINEIKIDQNESIKLIKYFDHEYVIHYYYKSFHKEHYIDCKTCKERK